MAVAAPRLAVLAAAALLVGSPCLGGRCLAPALGQDVKTEEKGTLYHFGTFAARTTLLFESETDLETIHGVSHEMSGTARLDLEGGAGTAKLTVPVAGMRTGIDKRDEHMRSETWLDAAKHPDIVFEATSLKRKEKDGKVWTYEGKLTIHGVTRDLKGEATVQKIPEKTGAALGPGSWVKVKTEFPVKLADFDVKVPEVAAAKVSGTWQVTVDIFGTTEPPEKK